MSFGALDWTVLAVFMLGLAAIVVWVALQKEENTADYFLAGRNAGWLVIGASIFASNIGSEHLVGLASAGASSGMARAHWEFHSWLIVMLAWVFVPFYLRAQVFTTPEFLERRYNSQTRTFFSFISLVAYVLTKVSVTVFAGGVAIQQIFGIDKMFGIDFFWIAAISLVVITALYTVIGGMKAVLWTSVLQTPALLLGSIIILFVGLTTLGGEGGLFEGFVVMKQSAGENIHLWRPISDPTYPWPGVLGGSVIIGLWYWCTDQYIVQRVLSARDMKQARRGALFGGYLKLMPVFIFLLPGMIAAAMVKTGDLTLPLLADGTPDPNTAFPVMVRELLPAGIKGVVLGGALAALMSSLASLFNSSATLFTVDFYERLFPGKTQKHYLTVGRIATVTVVLLGIAWVPIIKAGMLGDSLYDVLQNMQGFIAPAIVAIFFLGIFTKQITPTGGFIGMVLGFSVGMLKLVLQFTPDSVSAMPVLGFIRDVNPLYFSCLLLAFTVVIMFALSFVTKNKSDEELVGLTYASITPEQKAEVRASWSSWDIVHTVVILGLIAAAYIYFW